MPTNNVKFPPGFVWGAATAAYQIEGSAQADGKGESIWDRFCRVPGAVQGGGTGDVACDHYRRWPEDVALMRELGLNAYRFSVAWPRVFPEGKGAVNHAGLDFYDRLTDALLDAGITPFVTLYHWDLPQALQDTGGWANRDISPLFARYAETVALRLGDRVRHWITHNEPAVVSYLGNLEGIHAPGIRNARTAYRVAHNLLRSHGEAVRALRSASAGSQVGITLNLYAIHPAGDSAEDEKAARREDGFQNRWFLDPVFRGSYPEDIVEIIGEQMPTIEPGDMELIATPTDFLGVNYYSRTVVRNDPANAPRYGSAVQPSGSEYTDMGWEVYPDGLREVLERLHKEYPSPAYYVTENGAAYPDRPTVDGTIEDGRRQEFLEGHFEAASQAVAAGVPLRGYFVWSLMDNFEWSWGYSKRFGIVHVDYGTQRRTPKRSALWYREWIAAQA